MAAAGATAAGAQSAATWPVAGGWAGGNVGSRRCCCRLEKANSSSTHCHAVICECGDGGGGTGGGAARAGAARTGTWRTCSDDV